MARHKTTTIGGLRTTWARLSSRRIWSFGLIWFSAMVFAVATLLMDALRTEKLSWLWLAPYFGSLLVVIALVLVAKKLVLDKIADRWNGLANILTAAIVGGLKNFSVAIIATAVNLEAEVGLLFRFIGGVCMGIAILGIYSGITGSRAAHREALSELNAVRNDLLGSKENLSLLLDDELESLQTKSRETVLPKIAQISELLKGATETGVLVAAIREMVATQVRPLMTEISMSSVSGLALTPERSASGAGTSRPKTFVARDLIKPLTYFAYTFPAVGIVTFYFEGLSGLIFGGVSTISFVALMWLAKLVLFPKRATSRLLGYSMLTLASIVTPVVGLYVIGVELPLDAHESVLVPLVCWVIYIFSVAILSPTILLDAENQKFQELIETENIALAREIAVFEQKLWVFKRRWLFMLHGTVQSALTAALTRLQTFADSDPYQLGLVQADLERAEAALLSNPSNTIDFEKAVAELRESWAGVCAIRFDVDLRASRALVTNQGSAYCVNEILKEAVGNAVRHGGATGVAAKITRIKDDFIDLEIQNDGKAPRKGWKKGIGSRMLDDITTSWSLERSGRLTTLTARLPL